jgi:pimeloyl-ACP methyl ester carboxylesterase
MSFRRNQQDELPTSQEPHPRPKELTESGTHLSSPNSKHSSLFLSSSFVPLLLDLGTKALVGATGVAIIALGLLFVNQEKLLYIPQLESDIPRTNLANPPGYRTPLEYNLPFEEHWIRTEDGIDIHAWLLLQRSSSKPTIVFFHGNAGNIGIRLPNAQQIYELLDCNVLMVEYRGYGDSLGDSRPTEVGLKLDGEAAVKFIQEHPKVDPSKIILFGRSLGGAVAFHVAKKWQDSEGFIPLAGMMVENTFCSIDAMVGILFPFLRPVVKGPLLKMHWNSKEIAKSLTLPILYLAGEDDEIIPHSQMKYLYKISQGASRLALFHKVSKGMHNDTWIQGGRLYWSVILQFVRNTTKT